MSSLLKGLTSDESIAGEKDSLGGANVFESGLIEFNIETAYLMKATSGALGVVVNFKTEDGKSMRETFYVTSGDEKGNKNYYERDGKKNYLPGYQSVNSLCSLTVGKEIGEMETEQKVVKAYNADAGAEVPTKVDMLTDLLGKKILAGVIKQTVDKKKKEGKVYVNTGETREENTVDKFFRAKDKMTTAEIRAEATEATFVKDWEKKWTNVNRNKATATAGDAPRAGAPAAGATKKASLFSD